jgi:hypothetical protein
MFTDAAGNDFYFSYRTLVAFQPRNGQMFVHANDWGVTTGKHLNWIDGGSKKERLNDADFKAKYEELFQETVNA